MPPDRIHLISVPELDEDHIALAHIIAELEAAEESEAPTAQCSSIVARLIEAVREHFTAEECIMSLDGYPLLEHHREEHRRELAFIESVGKELSNGMVLSKERILSIWDWSLRHIDTSDREYAEYIRERTKSRTP